MENEIRRIASRIEGRGYKAYRDLQGVVFVNEGIKGSFTHIQGDPFAPPSWFEFRVPRNIHLLETPRFTRTDITALEDLLHRKLHELSRRLSRKCGTGGSCEIIVPRPKPIIVPRSSVEYDGAILTVRISVGLPAYGRRISGKLFIEVMRRVKKTMDFFRGLNRMRSEIMGQVSLIRDYEAIRRFLTDNNAVSFIAENSILPRESSLSDKPLMNAVPFKPPKEETVTVDLPSGVRLKGLLIDGRLTVITGGGYHGKTTLLEAIQDGIYPHIRGDGREYVVTDPTASTIYAEDGRLIHHVDISGFISNLPRRQDTVDFSSLDASGSTSMAASISEAVEVGSRLLLIDEDTSATNLLFKDRIMERLIPYDPITTLAENCRSFIRQTKTRIILIASSSSVFMPKADQIFLMKNYTPLKPHIQPGEIESRYAAEDKEYKPPKRRTYMGIDGLIKTRTRGLRIIFKYTRQTYEADLSRNPRIKEEGQARYIARTITWLLKEKMSAKAGELPIIINRNYDEKRFSYQGKPIPPNLTWTHGQDVVWLLNRLPNTLFKQ